MRASRTSAMRSSMRASNTACSATWHSAVPTDTRPTSPTGGTSLYSSRRLKHAVAYLRSVEASRRDTKSGTEKMRCSDSSDSGSGGGDGFEDRVSDRGTLFRM